jgi:hypothetical protein
MSRRAGEKLPSGKRMTRDYCREAYELYRARLHELSPELAKQIAVEWMAGCDDEAAGEVALVEILLACDLGCVLHLCVVCGTSRVGKLLEACAIEWRGPEHSQVVVAAIGGIIERRGVTVLACEETFSAGTRQKPWLRDVGRVQEGQAGFLEGMFGGRVRFMRVPPCDATSALIGFHVFGRPEIAAGRKGEHYQDALAVGLKTICRLEDEKKIGGPGRVVGGE